MFTQSIINYTTGILNTNLIHVNVTCDDLLVGKNIVITNGTYTYNRTVPSSMLFEVELPCLGKWNFKNPVTGKTESLTITYFGSYELNLKCYKIYSVIINHTMSDPQNMISYADDAVGMAEGSDDWWRVPIFNSLKNCVLADGGEFLAYLNKDNLNQYEDGSTYTPTLGQDVMLEIPRIGYRIKWIDDNRLKVSITNHPNDGSFNYDAFSLDSYNDCDKIYIGTYKGYGKNNKIYSMSGQTITASHSITEFRTRCRNRGEGYQQRTFASVKLMQCLMIIFYKSLNMQAACGYGYVKSSNTAGLKTGTANSYGFMSELIKASNPTYMTDQSHKVKCFGIEDAWGNFNEFVDGVCTDANYNILTCKLAKDFVSDGTGYDNNGNSGVSAAIDGKYLTRPQGTSNVGFIAHIADATATTNYCDVNSIKKSCVGRCGGAWSSNTGAGPFVMYFSMEATNTGNESSSCRLMFLHKEN